MESAMSYDYVIVGAGSAGCVLAHRLSADPRAKVLLIEAGGPCRKQEASIPAAFPKLFKTPVDWNYSTVEQERLKGRRLYWPRGKMLGGSSSMNAMIYIRGHRSDYDGWAARGNRGWSYEEVLPYFKRSEQQSRGASHFHGAKGPLQVSDLRFVNPLARAFVAAGCELGLKENADFNGEEQEGVGFYQVTQKLGRRSSAATAFLEPALKRPNLTVVTGAHATRVIFAGRRATGVEYARDGRRETATASSEVILSGGTINSPQLLMLSGVGAGDELRAHGIQVVHELPGVGRNLQDHLFLPVAYECTRPITMEKAERFGNVINYLVFHKGPLSSNIAEAGAFLRLDPAREAPDLQFHFGAVYYLEHGFKKHPGCGFTFGPTLIRPQSVGKITLNSADPFAPPAIDPHYLAAEGDLRVLVEGIRIARRLAQCTPFDPYRGAEVYPGPEIEDDQQLAEYVRSTVETVYHPVGTCRMGDDAGAVVDQELRVRGLEGLRVVDASVMPVIVGGNTNAPVIMIAEKAADLVRGGSVAGP
jgi:choline dehydrogenase